MDYARTQAKKLNEMVKFVCDMSKKGFEVSINDKGGFRAVRLSTKNPYKIKGFKAIYSKEFYEINGELIISKSTKKAVDVVKI